MWVFFIILSNMLSITLRLPLGWMALINNFVSNLDKELNTDIWRNIDTVSDNKWNKLFRSILDPSLLINFKVW